MDSKAVAVIGSRGTHSWAVNVLIRFTKILLSMGFTVRSGGSGMADRSAETACKEYHTKTGENVSAEIYIPSYGYKMNGRQLPPQFYIVPPKENMEESGRLLKRLKVAKGYDGLEDFIQRLFSRNVNQILGLGPGALPVDLVIYWAPEDKPDGIVKGGTRIAVNLARELGIPTFNVMFKEDREKLFEFIRWKKEIV